MRAAGVIAAALALAGPATAAAPVTLSGLRAGTCTITATQPGNVGYSSAPKIARTFTVAPRPARKR